MGVRLSNLTESKSTLGLLSASRHCFSIGILHCVILGSQSEVGSTLTRTPNRRKGGFLEPMTTKLSQASSSNSADVVFVCNILINLVVDGLDVFVHVRGAIFSLDLCDIVGRGRRSVLGWRKAMGRS